MRYPFNCGGLGKTERSEALGGVNVSGRASMGSSDPGHLRGGSLLNGDASHLAAVALADCFVINFILTVYELIRRLN